MEHITAKSNSQTIAIFLLARCIDFIQCKNEYFCVGYLDIIYLIEISVDTFITHRHDAMSHQNLAKAGGVMLSQIRFSCVYFTA